MNAGSNVWRASDLNPDENDYYRKPELYHMPWDVQLSTQLGVGGRFGGRDSSFFLSARLTPTAGPVAVWRDPKKPNPVSGPAGGKLAIRLFACSGKLLSTVVWDSVATVMAIGVSDSEKLVVVGSDCVVRYYSVHGELIHSYPLDAEVKEQGMLEAQVWGSGLCVLTKKLQFCVVANLDEPQPAMFARTGLKEPPASWCVVDANFTISGTAEVLVSTASGTILVVDADRVTDMKLTNGPFTKMTVSPTGKNLAAFRAAGFVWVVSTDFSQNHCEFKTRTKNPPQQLVWCGVECVVAYWDAVMLVIGPYGHSLKYDYENDTSLILVSEIDGLRIHSNKLCEFLQRVPSKTESIYKIGSTHPASMLNDAAVAFNEKSPKADELIRYIQANNALEASVQACIESALQEWSLVGQRNLMHAASFGKCFLSGHDPQPYVEACQELRLLNALRAPEVGMPISHLQYVVLTSSMVIDRLINRHHHFLAWKMSKYLKLRPNRVLIHWASAMVRKGRGDEQELCAAIVQKLREIPGISYAEIASAAFKNNRPNLATKLLDFEPRAADQIPLLICMNQEEIALQKAIESGDTDLIYLVLLHALRTLKEDFFHIVSGKPVAVKLMIKYARQQDPQLLRNLLTHLNDVDGQGDFAVHKALSAAVPEQRARMLTAAAEYYGKSKTSVFQKEACLDEVKLIRMQMDFEAAAIKEQYVGMSTMEFLKALILEGQDKKAEALCKEFKVSESKFYYAKLLALAEKGKWEQLRKFAESKKSPIGYAPFADACVTYNNVKEAKEYVAKIPEMHIQAPLYVRMEAYREAAQCAHQLKDPNALLQIREKCKNKDDQAFVDSLLKTL